EMRVIRLCYFRALFGLFQPPLNKLLYGIIKRRCGHIHLVKSLHGAKTRSGARLRIQRIFFCRLNGSRGHETWYSGTQAAPSLRFSSIISRQALAAPPPLFFSSTFARAHACAPFSTV